MLTEIPAGLLDVEGEDALTCAGRELFEETGYRHTAIEFLGGYYASAGFTDEYVHVFWARTPAHPEGEPEEGIEVITRPFEPDGGGSAGRQGTRREDGLRAPVGGDGPAAPIGGPGLSRLAHGAARVEVDP